MHGHRIALTATQRFSRLALDHASGDPFLDGFRASPPTLEGLRAAAARRFGADARAALVSALQRQYDGLPIDNPVAESIARLARPDALTVATGHQLCLFLGPLYVPFKLLNAIRLARALERDLVRPVIPVFWMASEDHDRAEIDHAWFGGHRLHWQGASGGAVGRMRLAGIGPVVEEACALLGPGPHADRIRALLRDCYRPGRTVAEATRRFAHALFGRFGLLIVDGDDRALKQRFVPIMREELLNGIGLRAVRHANERLVERYEPQAHARAINLFHLRDGHRARIEADGSHFRVLHGGPRFTLDELLHDLEARPQDYSPNVLLRPLYQETVLPNIAYIGGGGELAYWMQLKWLFQAVQLPMPVVLLRASAAFLSEKADRHRRELGLRIEDLFAPAHELRTRIARGGAGGAVLEAEREAALRAMDAARDRAAAIDPALAASAEALRARIGRAFDALQGKMDRALRRREAVRLARLDRILNELFPGGALQERRLSILPMLAARGEGLLDELLGALDPLDPRFTVLVDEA